MVKGRMGRPRSLEEPTTLYVRVSKAMLERIDHAAAVMTATSPYAVPVSRSQAARILLDYASARCAYPPGHKPKPGRAFFALDTDMPGEAEPEPEPPFTLDTDMAGEAGPEPAPPKGKAPKRKPKARKSAA